MRPLLAMACGLALAGCASSSSNRRAPDSRWILGRWCGDGSTMHYGFHVMLQPTNFYGDGSYSTFEDRGRWQLEGNQLRLLTQGQVHYVDTVERLGRDRMARTDAEGDREIWHRCAEKS